MVWIGVSVSGKAVAGAHAVPASQEKKGGRHAVALVTLAVVCLLAAAYGAGYYYFSSHFVPGTTVNGMDVSTMDVPTLTAQVDKAGEAWQTSITYGDGYELAIKASDIDLTVDGKGLADAAKAETEPSRWVIDMLQPQGIVVDEAVSYDEDKLKALVDASVEEYNGTAQAPTDAAPRYDEEKKAYVVAPEAAGTQLKAEAVEAAADECAGDLKDSVQLTDDALIQPNVTSDNDKLTSAVDAANKMIALDIPLTVNDKEVAHVTGDLIKGWISFGDDYAVTLDTGAIKKWAKKELKSAAARTDEAHTYGLDADATVNAIADAIQSNKSDSIEVSTKVLSDLPAATEGASELGRHIDVNLTTQYARMYDDEGEVIWSSYIVSGDMGEDRATPTGTYAINGNKAKNQTLIGADEDEDGEPDYKSKVTYWMPFIGNDVGLHDASWRSQCGGSIYQYNGSHGCVNLPTDKAAQLYELTRVGDKVIVHW